MFDRILKKSTPDNKKDTNDKGQKLTLDELAVNSDVIDRETMSKIEGGHTSAPNSLSNDRTNNYYFDLTSTPRGNVPS